MTNRIPIDEIDNEIPAIVGTAVELRNLNSAYAEFAIIKGLGITPSIAACLDDGRLWMAWLLDAEPSPEQHRAVAARLEQYGIAVAPLGGEVVVPLDAAVVRGSADQGQSANVYPLGDV